MATGVIQLHLSRSGTNTTQLLGSVFLRAPPISSQFRLICVLLCTCSGSAYPGGGQGSPRATSGLRGLSLGQWQTSFSLAQTGEALLQVTSSSRDEPGCFQSNPKPPAMTGSSNLSLRKKRRGWGGNFICSTIFTMHLLCSKHCCRCNGHTKLRKFFFLKIRKTP